MLSSNCSDQEDMQYLSHNFGQVRNLNSKDKGKNGGLLINQHNDDDSPKNKLLDGKARQFNKEERKDQMEVDNSP